MKARFKKGKLKRKFIKLTMLLPIGKLYKISAETGFLK
tara:strand:- start:28 stop:141 length:114 start_codon:yes stop_codon:yes gene_type:complete